MKTVILGAICLTIIYSSLTVSADTLTIQGREIEIAAPALVASSSVQEFGWMPDGNHAWVLGRQGADNILTLWSMSSSKFQEVWRGRESLTQITALPGSAVLVAIMSGDQPGLLRVRADHSPPQVFRGEAFRNLELFVSPTAALVAAKSVAKTGISVTLIGGSDSAARVFTLPQTIISADVIWSRDGKSAYVRTPETAGDVYYALDAASEKSARLTSKPELWQRTSAKPLAVDIKSSAFEIKEGTSSATRSALWLCESGSQNGPAALISSDCSSGQLSPTGGGVLYVSQDALFARLFNAR